MLKVLLKEINMWISERQQYTAMSGIDCPVSKCLAPGVYTRYPPMVAMQRMDQGVMPLALVLQQEQRMLWVPAPALAPPRQD